MKKFFTFVIIFFTFCHLQLYGWWDLGHMAIAQIAYDRLEKEVKEQAEESISLLAEQFPESKDFITAACWADDLLQDHLQLFEDWHYAQEAYDPQNILSSSHLSNKNKENNIISIIQKSYNTLANPLAGQWGKAFALRFIIHLVGDLHQPLNCASLYNKQFKEGDQHGSLFSISLKPPINNLYKLWDSGFGIFLTKPPRPLIEADKLYIETFARSIAEKFPYEKLKEKNHTTLEQWFQESLSLNRDVVYQGILPGDIPSETYLTEGQGQVLKRIALAGYRLADLLNEVLKNP